MRSEHRLIVVRQRAALDIAGWGEVRENAGLKRHAVTTRAERQQVGKGHQSSCGFN
jgi:hypothetical protein